MNNLCTGDHILSSHRRMGISLEMGSPSSGSHRRQTLNCTELLHWIDKSQSASTSNKNLTKECLDGLDLASAKTAALAVKGLLEEAKLLQSSTEIDESSDVEQ